MRTETLAQRFEQVRLDRMEKRAKQAYDKLFRPKTEPAAKAHRLLPELQHLSAPGPPQGFRDEEDLTTAFGRNSPVSALLAKRDEAANNQRDTKNGKSGKKSRNTQRARLELNELADYFERSYPETKTA